MLRAGLIVSIAGVLFGIFLSNNASIPSLVIISVVLGIAYAGTANIMLNGLESCFLLRTILVTFQA